MENDDHTSGIAGNHSDNFLLMASRSDHLEAMVEPDGYALRTGVCGDTVEMFVQVRDGQLERISFQISGCLNTVACCNSVAYLLEGRPVDDAWRLTPELLIDFLQSLPADHHHCAELVAGALYTALQDYQQRRGAR